MNEPEAAAEQSAELCRLLGQRRAFTAVAGRCSAAHAQLLRRIHDEKLYLPLAPSWRAFCGTHLAITCRHADRLIALLNRFGPAYFEISQLVGISPRQYVSIESVVRQHSTQLNGQTISLIPENAPLVLDAVDQLLRQSRRTGHQPRSSESLRQRVIKLTNRARDIAHQLVRLHHNSHSAADREFILEAANELRIILLQPDYDSPR